MSWRDAFRKWRKRSRHTGPAESAPKGRQPGRNERARNCEEWAAEQFGRVPQEAPIRQLVIGLDFGTSYTKVAIGEVRTSYAVPFVLSDGNVSYLLPTVLQWDREESDHVHLQSANPALTRIDRLKIRLLDGDTSAEARVHVAAYLALVLRHVRGWLMTQHRGTYGSNRLDWLINVGLPTETYFGSALAKVYKEVVETAWRLSIHPGPLTMAAASAAFDDPPPDPVGGALHPDKISPFPELAAEVAAYLRSPMRREDLHLLVDVGAGTLDVAMFNVYETDEQEPLLPVFAKSVSRHGTAYLMDARRACCPRGHGFAWSYQDPVPDIPAIVAHTGAQESELREADADFEREVREAILAPVWETWERKYPSSRRWDEGVPVIGCGGGMGSEYFEELMDRLVARGKPFRFQRLRFPRPGNLQAPNVDSEDVDRLNVAYGLSFDPFDIAHTWGPDEIEDFPRDTSPSPYGGPYVDKDMV